MSKARAEEKRWKKFERELKEAIEKDKTVTKEERLAWLNTLPEFVPQLTANSVKVIFFEGTRCIRTRCKRK